MNKNLKILSSIAVAGILATAGLTNVSKAATPLGIYRKVVAGKTIAPYIAANSNEKITAKKVKDDNGDITINLADGTAVKTGDTFKVKGKNDDHIIIVYGDVNKDSAIDVRDVTTLANGWANNTLDSIQKEAGDIAHNGRIDVNDIRQLAGFIVRDEAMNITLPKEEETPTVYNYTIEANEGVINNQNQPSTTIYVKADTIPSTAKTLTVKVTDEEGNTATTTVTISNDSKDIWNQATVSLSGLTGKKATIELIDEADNDKVVGSTTVDLHTDAPEASKVSVTRKGDRTASMNLTNVGENEITKVHYIIVDSNSSVADINAFNAHADKQTVNANLASGATREIAKIKTDLANTAYKVYYVLEDNYGSMTAMQELDLPAEGAVAQLKVTGITAPDLTTSSVAKFSWTVEAAPANATAPTATEGPANGDKFAIVLYNGETPVKEVIQTYDTTDSTTIANSLSYDFTSDMTKPGKYSVGVTVKSNKYKTDSEEVVKAATGEVTVLESVGTPVYKDGKITWTDAKNTQENLVYDVEVATLSGKTWSAYTPVANGTGVTNKEITFAPTAGTIYKVKVTAKVTGTQCAIRPSEATESTEFYTVDSAIGNITEVTENTVTIELADDIKVNDQIATYTAKAYIISEEADAVTGGTTSEEYKDAVVNVADKKIVISNLKADRNYAFKIIANVNGITGESNYIAAKTSPVISELTVVEKETEAVAGSKTIFFKNNSAGAPVAVIEGQEKVISTYSAEFQNAIAIAKKLHVGDTITATGKNITLELKQNEDVAGTLALANLAKGMKLTITGNDSTRTITSTATTGELEEVILQGKNGNEALFNTTGLNAKAVTLKNGADVIDSTATGTNKYTVAENQTANINGVKVTTELATTITTNTNSTTSKTLNVTANGENTENNLTFENLKGDYLSTRNTIINFVSANSTKQIGTITIKSEGGKITVTESGKVDVKSKLTVEVEKGEVEVDQDTQITGEKEIKVNFKANEAGKTTVIATAKKESPVPTTTGKSIQIKDYSDTTVAVNEADYTVATPTETAVTMDADQRAKFVEFIDSIRKDANGNVVIPDGVATISIGGANNNEVTITFTTTTTTFNTNKTITIPGLK